MGNEEHSERYSMGITSNDKLIIIESKQNCIKNEVDCFNYDVSDEDLCLCDWHTNVEQKEMVSFEKFPYGNYEEDFP